MGRIQFPLPGKLIVSAIYANLNSMIDAISMLEKKYGRVELETDEIDFLHTTYYREEMGNNLKRKFFSFHDPIDRADLADVKVQTNKIEEMYGEKSADFVFRSVNLDPGVLTPANLILASTKDYSHRVYLREGIFAEITLIYRKKKFAALPWTYPDYTEPEVLEFLYRARESLQMHEVEL